MVDGEISDFALIGNSCGAALVSKYGSIDWCCLPEFDSPAIFAALLDRDIGGFFAIHPQGVYESAQKYLTDTNVVETVFTTGSGQASLTDAFTAMTEEENQRSLNPDHEILRIVEGTSGTTFLRMQFIPRTNYGKSAASLEDYGKLGITFTWKGHICTLITTLSTEKIKLVGDEKAEAEFEISVGQRIIFSLSYCNQAPAIIPELKETGWNRMANTVTYWRDWIGSCTYSGLYAEHVKRSALALKLLAHAPSGAIIAAPTTSLPENPGHERNWDYRYCWLRDASFTIRVLLKLGFEQEAHAYTNWILHATQLTRPRLQVVYTTYGHTKLKESILDWLSGYRESTPVRVGNNAYDQFQLDVYGEVLDAIYAYSSIVQQFDRDTRMFIIGLGKVICKIWNQPDHGIWEIQSSKKHHTHSKVMCWVGLDRLMKVCRKYQWREAPMQAFHETSEKIRAEVEHAGYKDTLSAYVGTLGSQDLDASALTFSLVGYTKFDSPRMVSTMQAICKHLLEQYMVYRYKGLDDGLSGKEGAFALCNFWLAENLARSGSYDEARKIFEATLNCMGAAGLLSEQIDPATGGLLGNYPQAFTHIGLVNAALAIDEEYTKQQLHQKDSILQK